MCSMNEKSMFVDKKELAFGDSLIAVADPTLRWMIQPTEEISLGELGKFFIFSETGFLSSYGSQEFSLAPQSQIHLL